MNTGNAYIKCPDCRKKTPVDHQFCQHCLYNIHYRTVNTSYRPNFVDIHKRLLPDPQKMDSQGEIKAVDVLLEEREKETKVSKRAAAWEKSRKEEWKANKKYALKQS